MPSCLNPSIQPCMDPCTHPSATDPLTHPNAFLHLFFRSVTPSFLHFCTSALLPLQSPFGNHSLLIYAFIRCLRRMRRMDSIATSSDHPQMSIIYVYIYTTIHTYTCIYIYSFWGRASLTYLSGGKAHVVARPGLATLKACLRGRD